MRSNVRTPGALPVGRSSSIRRLTARRNRSHEDALEDITVLDLSHALAGPHASTMLADFGARVIKLETPGAGDIARAWGSPLPGGENSISLPCINKKGISIDPKTEEGKALFFALAEKADVILENFRPGALERLGLGYEAVKARQSAHRLHLGLRLRPGWPLSGARGAGPDPAGRKRRISDRCRRQPRCTLVGSIADLDGWMWPRPRHAARTAGPRDDRRGRVDVFDARGADVAARVMISAYLADGEVPQPMGTAYKALLPYQTFPDPDTLTWRWPWEAKNSGRSFAR
ncbi:MAG: CoA transferase [Burkholderiaceae bacterium]